MPNLVLLDQSGGVATVTLNRPEKLNAFADDMRERLAETLDAIAHDPAVRALVITGAGRAFSAGGDVRHMADLKQRSAGFDELRRLLDAGRAVITRLAALPFPTIAAVNGAAAGAGLNLALACDLRIVSDQASLGETFVRVGLHPDWGGTYHLPRQIGLSRALEMCWLGDMIDAAEALRIGLVSRVVPHDRLAGEVQGFAARVAAAPQASVRLVKRTLTASFERTLEQCLDAEEEAQAACWESADAAEGLRAFVEKRSPVFGQTTEVVPDSLDAAPSSASRQFE
jgi:2-(1,2-epoxy-1,2-dihydrophenyl)acetyl-CoA isomerase